MQSIALNRTVKSVIVLLALVAAAAVPGFALAYTISPSGGDDTAEIQEALTECAISGENCVIQLQSGQFNVSGLNTTGFRGSLCGGGMDDTIVLAVGSGANADLLRFVDSEVTISDFTIRLPSEISKLDSVIKITGTLGDSRVTRVGIEGYAGEYKATNGVAILGNPSIGGSHQVTNSSINHIQWALVAANTSGAHVRFGGSASKGNTIDYADRAVTTMTMNASQFDLSFNTATNIRGNPGMAIWAHSATTLSHYRIHHNLLEFVGTTPAICVWDRPNGMLPSPPVVTMQVEIMHNTIHMNALSPPPDPAASYWWAIHPWLLDAPLIAQNKVTGSSAIGVYLHGPIQGGVVVRNDLSDFSDLVVPIMLDSGTANNVVVGGSQPVGVYDLGTNNTLAGGTYPVSP